MKINNKKSKRLRFDWAEIPKKKKSYANLDNIFVLV